MNESVGEFLYALEGVASLPQPTSIPHNPDSPHAVRVSSAAASVKGKWSSLLVNICVQGRVKGGGQY